MSGSDLLDTLIAIAIILLILSLINEAITKLIRKYIPHLNTISRFLAKLLGKAISVISTQPKAKEAYDSAITSIVRSIKEYNSAIGDKPDSEQKQDKEVLILSVGVGVVVAFLTNSDLYTLFEYINQKNSADFSNHLFKPVISNEIDWWKLLSIVLTGCFLSLGSKFFHDLLETLLEIKNLRRKLNTRETYEIETIQEFDEYIKLTEGELVRKAIKENREFIMSRPNVLAVGIGVTMRNGQEVRCAVVHLGDANREKIPNDFNATLSSGREIKVPVVIVPNVEMPDVELAPGDALANDKSYRIKKYKGTLGCVLKEIAGNDRFLLTCSHVLNAGSSQNLHGLVQNGDKILHITNAALKAIGHWHYGLRNTQFDIALVALNAYTFADNQIAGGRLNAVRQVTDNDVKTHTAVFLHGAVSRMQEGIIERIECSAKIKYKDGVVELKNLISASRKDAVGNWQAISKKGDSGAVIYDKDRNVLGMIVAGNSQFSYAIPMDTILEQLDKQLA